jgi:hypothetical protein
MKRHITYNSIEQFRNIVTNVKRATDYLGQDENNSPIYSTKKEYPIIKAIGSEKIHGTNAAICYSNIDGFWVQSRENIITPENDNAGCAFFAMQNEGKWKKLIDSLEKEYKIDLNKSIISIFYEWGGGNIQKKSALSGLDKRAIIFHHFKVSPIEPNTEEKSYWLETCVKNNTSKDKEEEWISFEETNIFNIMDFPLYEIDIDFNKPDIAQNKLVELVDQIEHNSPVGNKFGFVGNIAEGVVFTFEYKGELYKFKVKGEKHANSKVKVLIPIDSEKEELKRNLAVELCPAWRLEQGWQNIFGIENEKNNPDMRFMADFLRWVHNDIIKEDSDKIANAKIEPKEINGIVSTIARNWFIDELNHFVMK